MDVDLLWFLVQRHDVLTAIREEIESGNHQSFDIISVLVSSRDEIISITGINYLPEAGIINDAHS